MLMWVVAMLGCVAKADRLHKHKQAGQNQAKAKRVKQTHCDYITKHRRASIGLLSIVRLNRTHRFGDQISFGVAQQGVFNAGPCDRRLADLQHDRDGKG